MMDEDKSTANCGACPEKESLVAYIYDEVDRVEQRALASHLDQCETCAAEVVALREVRSNLASWTAPALAQGFELVPRRAAGWPAWRPMVGYAAAAALVLGVSAGIANLDVRYGSQGLVVRTGWSKPDLDVSSAAGDAPGAAGTGIPARVSLRDVSDRENAWRAELSAMESRLRSEFGAVPSGGPAAAVAPGVPPAEWVREMQRLVDESEVRQQQNLALRIREVSNEFDLQRQADHVQLQQGLGQLGIDATQHKQMWDYFRRVANQESR